MILGDIEDCLDCLAFGETKYAKQNGYFRDIENLREALRTNNRGKEKIDFIIEEVYKRWGKQKDKRVAEYERAFKLRGLYDVLYKSRINSTEACYYGY